MKVWVLMTGAYDNYDLEAVFATAEAARAYWNPENPAPIPKKYRHPTQKLPAYEWSKEKDGSWWFDGDQSHCASLEEWEVR